MRRVINGNICVGSIWLTFSVEETQKEYPDFELDPKPDHPDKHPADPDRNVKQAVHNLVKKHKVRPSRIKLFKEGFFLWGIIIM